ncbi:hypothetical protein SD72_03765 [Leucobacter komagatae]|uniref:Uncharacterized protein n=1 Tax=Leucobacter komagatae TaxID=55969 RepID=A0A0D0H7Z8_9MICO|nr:hypothetical protein SD72_03765 [Leucobacter komagatae]
MARRRSPKPSSPQTNGCCSGSRRASRLHQGSSSPRRAVANRIRSRSCSPVTPACSPQRSPRPPRCPRRSRASLLRAPPQPRRASQ